MTRWRLAAGAFLTGLVLLGGSALAGAQTLTWSVVPSPNLALNNVLDDVSCVSATVCTAVGHHGRFSNVGKTLIESWDGTRWSVVPSPNPVTTDLLNSVSCVSATACAAAGFYTSTGQPYKTLIETGTASR